jgi:hypothetical protein
MSEAPPTPAAADAQPHPLVTAVKLFTSAYRIELILFVVTFVVLSFFSSQRFLRQSAAPHFVYQAQALLEGRLDIDPQVLPNLEDWACVREVGGVPTRCTRPLLPTDKWYSSFPAFPAVAMLPFVAIHSYQFNDTSFGVLWAALAVALFYSLIRLVAQQEAMDEDPREHIALALLLAFGTVFFYCAIRGEVWFSAEVMGVAFTCLYARNAVRARRPVLAGLFFSMAVMTRTPLLFTGIFFVLEALAPTRGKRLEELKALTKNFSVAGRKLGLFAAGAAPIALAGAIFNKVRFGSFGEFGHRFFYENRVNRDIDTLGLFDFSYLARNLEAAFLKLPRLTSSPWTISYDPWGLSLLLTLPLLVLVFAPAHKPRAYLLAVGSAAGVLIVSAMFPSEPGVALGVRSTLVWLAFTAAIFVQASLWQSDDQPSRLKVPLAITIAACALPGLFYQNTGYAQFGFRFSLDYTVYVLMMFAVSAWSLKTPKVAVLAGLAVLVNFWGAVGFRGYTELVRGW